MTTEKNIVTNCFFKSFFAAVIFTFFLIEIYSQPITTSEKNQVASSAQTDSSLGNYLKYCNKIKNTSGDSLCKYAHLAHDIAYTKPNADNKLLSDFFCAQCMLLHANIDSAKKIANSVFANIKDSLKQSNIYELTGQLQVALLIRSEKYKDAVGASLKYLSFAESIKDTLFEIIFKNYVGLAHMRLLQKQDALTWFRKGLSTSSNENFYRQFPFIYGNIGILFATLSQWDSSTHYASIAIKYETDSQNYSALAGVLPALGAVYMETNKQEMAKSCFDESLGDAKKLGDPYMTIAALIANATYQHEVKDYNKSISFCLNALTEITEYQLRSQLPYTYQTLAEDYKQVKDYKNYSQTLEAYLALKDSSYKKNSAAAIADLQTKYEVQQKENTIIRQQLELGKKNFWIYGGFILCATIILFSIFLFRANKNKQKIKLELLQKEEQFKSAQAVKDAEEKERNRVAAELHDDMGTRINILSHAATRLMQVSPELGSQIKETSDDLMQSLRETVWTLKQETILVSDVWVRFKNFVSKLRNTYSNIKFEIRETECPEKTLQYNEALHLIRILQEAAGNAVKHSACSEILCEKKPSDNFILFGVSDNGKGFSTNDEADSSGNGIPNMMQRSGESNFKFAIHSEPGIGTTVEIAI